MFIGFAIPRLGLYIFVLSKLVFSPKNGRGKLRKALLFDDSGKRRAERKPLFKIANLI